LLSATSEIIILQKQFLEQGDKFFPSAQVIEKMV